MTDPATATAAVFTTLKNALDLLKIIRNADNAKAAEQATRDLQDYIFKQNDRIVADSARVIELNDKCLAHKDKILELEEELKRREDYTLVEIGLGFKAYLLRESTVSTKEITVDKTPNYICQPCYDVRRQIVHLQPHIADGRRIGYKCRGCESLFITEHINLPRRAKMDYNPLDENDD